MSVVLSGFIGVVTGVLSHMLLYDLTEQHTDPPDLYRYGLGVLATLPVYALFHRQDRNDGGGERSFILAFVSMGLGVLFGRLLRKLWQTV